MISFSSKAMDLNLSILHLSLWEPRLLSQAVPNNLLEREAKIQCFGWVCPASAPLGRVDGEVPAQGPGAVTSHSLLAGIGPCCFLE